MAVPLTYRERAARKLPRLRKLGHQWLRVAAAGGRPTTRVVFVVGSQRSGTRVPLRVLERSPDVFTFSEGTSPYFQRVFLQPLDVIERLLSRSPFPVVALKPICETHRVIELLEHFPGSRALWIFRNYQDAVNSASAKWMSGREAVRRLAHGELQAASWRAGGLTSERLEFVRSVYSDSMSLHAANAVMWLLRNGLFFDLHADRRSDVMLLRYEDVVEDTAQQSARLFGFLGLDDPGGARGRLYRSSVSKESFPEIPSEIRERCESLQSRLREHYASVLEPSIALVNR